MRAFITAALTVMVCVGVCATGLSAYAASRESFINPCLLKPKALGVRTLSIAGATYILPKLNPPCDEAFCQCTCYSTTCLDCQTFGGLTCVADGCKCKPFGSPTCSINDDCGVNMAGARGHGRLCWFLTK